MADTTRAAMRVMATVIQPCSAGLRGAVTAGQPTPAAAGSGRLSVRCTPGKPYAIQLRAARLLGAPADPARTGARPLHRPFSALALDEIQYSIEVAPGTGAEQHYPLIDADSGSRFTVVTVTF